MLPVLFNLPMPWGDQPIYSYGLMLGLSLIAGWHLVLRLGEAQGLDRDRLGNTYMVTAISALVGARLLYVLTNLGDMHSFSDVLNVRQGGLVVYGGFLGGFLGCLAFMRMRGGSVLAFADLGAPAIALGLILGRTGCYLYGCDFGSELSADAPQWLKSMGTFPRWQHGDFLVGAPAYLWHRDSGLIEDSASVSLPVHPTQLYEAAAGLVLLGLTVWWRARRRFEGQVFLALVMVYSLWRYFLEELRGDPERGMLLGFSTSQLIAVLLVPVTAITYSVLSGRARAASVAVAASPGGPAPEPDTEAPYQGKLVKPKAKKKR